MQNKYIHIDYELLVRLSQGDEKAFVLVFETYHKYLYALASRYLMSESYAEDAVHYTFMKLWEKRASFDYSKGIKNLLFTILKNYVLNELKHNNMALQNNYQLAQFSETVEKDFLSKIELSDLKSHLYGLIDKLPPQKRIVCLLKIQQGLSNQEVAEKMDVSIITVKSHYTQAIKFLRIEMAKLISIIILFKYLF